MSLEINLFYLTKVDYENENVSSGTPFNALKMENFIEIHSNLKKIYVRLEIKNSSNQTAKPNIWYSIPSTNLTLLENFTKITLAQSSTDIVSKLDNNLLEFFLKINGNELRLTHSRSSMGLILQPQETIKLFGEIVMKKFPAEQFEIFKGSFDINIDSEDAQ